MRLLIGEVVGRHDASRSLIEEAIERPYEKRWPIEEKIGRRSASRRLIEEAIRRRCV